MELAALDLDALTSWRDRPWLIVIGKGGRQRAIPLPSEIIAELNALRTAYNAPHSVFVPALHRDSVTRISTSTIWRAVRRAAIATLDRPLNPHSLRHTAATLMLSAPGGSLLAVRSILGHSSVTTTERYLHTLPGEIVRTMDSYLISVAVVPTVHASARSRRVLEVANA